MLLLSKKLNPKSNVFPHLLLVFYQSSARNILRYLFSIYLLPIFCLSACLGTNTFDLFTTFNSGLPIHKVEYPAFTICSQGQVKNVLDNAINKQFEEFVMKVKGKKKSKNRRKRDINLSQSTMNSLSLICEYICLCMSYIRPEPRIHVLPSPRCRY